MKIVNMHEAKTQLSSLVKEVAKGNHFVIAVSGVPMATVIPYKKIAKKNNRIGFLKNEITIPDDFDKLASDKITSLFQGGGK
ncbi:MAG: type II toxin-antitoxin system prevent-host-death family antitoxin [Planctomycetaceae bacterium]|jgi:prevent-host-death family protein|nr:type II toxin-antitoxin system prevent-host-death family antitoxin [Planctomycetaceae bacterium]